MSGHTKRDNIVDPKSCWNQAHEDEPVFILKSTDPLAPLIVQLWAQRYLHRKIQEGVASTDKVRDKYMDAMQTAQDMQTWHGANRRAVQEASR